MRLWVETGLVALVLLVTGLGGGLLSKAIRDHGWNPMWAYATTPITATVWLWQVKYGSLSLTKASSIYDVMLCLSWFVGFALLGEVISAQQWLGVLLLCIGLALVNA